MFKDISLEFSDGTKVDYQLNDFYGGIDEWNVVTINDPPQSDFVKIKAKSVYGTNNNGFNEIRIFGCLTAGILCDYTIAHI